MTLYRSYITFLIVLLFVTVSLAADRENPKYDPKTEIQFQGAVQELKSGAKENANIHLLVNTENEAYDVDLCPKTFLEEAEMSFEAGDKIEVTGSKIKDNDNEMVIAREIVKGDEKLVLRDKNGGPVWVWLKK